MLLESHHASSAAARQLAQDQRRRTLLQALVLGGLTAGSGLRPALAGVPPRSLPRLIRLQDAEGARRAMRGHIENARTRMFNSRPGL